MCRGREQCEPHFQCVLLRGRDPGISIRRDRYGDGAGRDADEGALQGGREERALQDGDGRQRVQGEAR